MTTGHYFVRGKTAAEWKAEREAEDREAQAKRTPLARMLDIPDRELGALAARLLDVEHDFRDAGALFRELSHRVVESGVQDHALSAAANLAAIACEALADGSGVRMDRLGRRLEEALEKEGEE